MRIRRTYSNAAVVVSAALLIVVVASANAEAVEWLSLAQNDQTIRALDPNKPIERELMAGQVHSYQVTLTVGQYLQVNVEQRGIDVVIKLLGPDGQKMNEVDSSNGLDGIESVSIIAKTPGLHRLEIISPDKSAAPGRYEMKIAALREATLQDRTDYFASALGAVKSAEDRNALLSAQKELVTKELVQSLFKQAQALQVQRKYQQALELLRLAQQIAEQISARPEMARVMRGLGVIHFSLGNYSEALEYFLQSLTLYESLGDKVAIADSLNNIASVHLNSGNYSNASEYYQKSLALQEAPEDKGMTARSLSGVGLAHFFQGNYTLALEYFRQSLAIRESQGDKNGIAYTLFYIGEVYLKQSDYNQALECFRKGQAISESLGNKSGIAHALNDIGMVYLEQENHTQALVYFQKSLALIEAMEDKRKLAIVLNNIGEARRERGDYAQALAHYQKSLALCESLGDKEGIAIALGNIGAVYYAQRDYPQALVFTQRAASIARSIGLKAYLWDALSYVGRAYRALGKPAEARQALEEAIETIESLRSQVAGRESRASFLASRLRAYEYYIDLLMEIHKSRPQEDAQTLAFQTSERARARSLVELLIEARADIRQGVDPTVLERERKIQRQLQAKADRLRGMLQSKHTQEQVSAAEREIEKAVHEYQQAQAEIRRNSPRYAALTQPAPLSLKEIQQQTLDEDTLLLEYALGKERSYLWAITPASITSYELPGQDAIEQAARRAYERFIISNRREAKRSAELAAAELSQMVLGPAAAELRARRLLIVADGALQYVPFGALPKPAGKDAARDFRPLIADHEVVHLPSASTLAVLRRELAGRPPANKTVATLADPVLQNDDVRVKRVVARVRDDSNRSMPASEDARGAPGDLLRSAKETGVLTFERLPFTRREAEEITALAGGDHLKALDFKASRATALSPELSQYRIVHFATHGLLNSQHPEISGIVLSLFDERGQPQSGFLRLHDIYNLKLNADLVTLSACQTALGKEVKGEGLVGLTRGFMYAGAPRVVASLWNVKDEATAELMKRFYSGMLKDGLRPAAALRSAQISLSREKRWEAPYYWAGFTLQGEWK